MEEKQIITSCRDCIFAIWDDKTQVGCQFDRIDKFEEHGAEIIGQDDGEKQYFLIYGRFCTACRNKDWGKQHPRRQWKQLVEDKIKLQMDIIINVDADYDLTDIMTTVNSAYDQQPSPRLVIIACDPQYSKTPVTDIVANMRNESRGPWRVENQSAEKAARFCKSTYYAIFNAGYRIPADFSSTLDRAININMDRFAALLPDEDGNGLVMQQCGMSLEKFMEMAENTNTGHMIKKYEDL